MRCDWNIVTLGDVLKHNGYIRGPFGSALRRNELLDSGIPVYEQQHAIYGIRDFRFFINNKKFIEMKRFETKVNDLIISCSGTLGRVSMIMKNDPIGIISQALLILRVNTDLVLPQYLYYFFSSKEGYNTIISRSSGSVQINISKRANIEKIPLSLPPINEQQVIVDILSTLDAKIANNTKINHHLEQMSQAIFKSWFVDFEPWGGVMPSDWREGALGDVASITSGKRPIYRQAEFSAEAEIPLIGASSIMGYTNIVLYDERILVTGRVGTHGIIQRYYRPCWASDNTLVIKSNYYEFTYQLLCGVDFHNMNRGSTQPLITQTDLKNVPILLPNEATLRKFEELVGSLMEQYEANILESERLKETRDKLSPRLMSGELSVAT